MMMPLYGTALASVSRWMVVLKAFSLDCMQCEAPVWRHWLWHSTSGMGDIHPGRQSCNCSPPVLYPSLTGSCLSSVESPNFSFHTVFPFFFCKTWTLFLTILYLCLVRDLTLLVGWFDELPSALNFSMVRNMLWKYWDFFFRIGVWQISQNFFRQEVK